MWSKLGTAAIMAAFLAGTAAVSHAQAVPTRGVASGTTTAALAVGTPGTGYYGGFANGYGIAPGGAGTSNPGPAAGWGGRGIGGSGSGYGSGWGYGGGIGGAPTSGQGSSNAGVGTAG